MSVGKSEMAKCLEVSSVALCVCVCVCNVYIYVKDIRERTLIAVKPDGVQRRLIGQIIQRFEMRGFRLVGLKMLQVKNSLQTYEYGKHILLQSPQPVLYTPSVSQVSEELLSQHYMSLCKKSFYPSLLHYMTSGPVVAMVSGPSLV